jgi:hypothetical protein
VLGEIKRLVGVVVQRLSSCVGRRGPLGWCVYRPLWTPDAVSHRGRRFRVPIKGSNLRLPASGVNPLFFFKLDTPMACVSSLLTPSLRTFCKTVYRVFA